MLNRDILTKNLVLIPMTVNVNALGAWRVLHEQKALGFVLVFKHDNDVLVHFCLTDKCTGYMDEAVRGLTDTLFEIFPCDFVRALVPLHQEELRESLLAEGFCSAPAISQPDPQGQPMACIPMALDRFSWYGLNTSRPFPEIHKIEGENLDLYCTYTLEASVEKGLVPTYCFEIAPHGEMQTIGRIDLRLGYTEKTYYGGNIGYGLQEAYRGRGYAAEACRMLEPLIRRHGMHRIVITCRPDNLPSRGTCENLGARFVRQLELPVHTELYENGDRDLCVYHWVL